MAFQGLIPLEPTMGTYVREYLNHCFLRMRGPSPLRRYLQANTRLPPMRGRRPATPRPSFVQIFPEGAELIKIL